MRCPKYANPASPTPTSDSQRQPQRLHALFAAELVAGLMLLAACCMLHRMLHAACCTLLHVERKMLCPLSTPDPLPCLAYAVRYAVSDAHCCTRYWSTAQRKDSPREKRGCTALHCVASRRFFCRCAALQNERTRSSARVARRVAYWLEQALERQRHADGRRQITAGLTPT